MRPSVALAYAAIVAGWPVFSRPADRVLPSEDQGRHLDLTLPSGATLSRTSQVAHHRGTFPRHREGQRRVIFSVAGFSFIGVGQPECFGSSGLGPAQGKTTSRRPSRAVPRSSCRQSATLRSSRDPAPTMAGRVRRVRLQLQATAGTDSAELAKHVTPGRERDQNPKLMAVRLNEFRRRPSSRSLSTRPRPPRTPWPALHRQDAPALGSVYVNDFIDRGRRPAGFVQGDAGSVRARRSRRL